MRFLLPLLLSLSILCSGCATSGGSATARAARVPRDSPPDAAADSAQAARLPDGPLAELKIDLSNIRGVPLAGQVDLLYLANGARKIIPVPRGELTASVPTGAYRAYVHVYEENIAVLCDIQDLSVAEGQSNFLLTTLLEGAAGTAPIRAYDTDGDLALNSVEDKVGTNPDDATSVPGRSLLEWPAPVLGANKGWYAGELFAHSKYGQGTEGVAELVARAERSKLDFLAIADPPTLDSAKDPGFKSNSMVLIPAIYWGTPKMGYAILYGPRTTPDPPSTVPAAQAECIRVQAQGGLFAIAHPCFPTAPWQWGLSYANAVQVWARPWNAVPPMATAQLREPLQARTPEGKLIHSIAAAGSLGEISANDQASRFYDYELVRGLLAASVGGSMSGSAQVPLGRPITWVYAEEKSVRGILEGIRAGKTFVSSGLDGPKIQFQADVLGDDKVDILEPGGIIPQSVATSLWVSVEGADGKKLQVLANGYPILTRLIEGGFFATRVPVRPDAYTAYRVRVVGRPDTTDQVPDFGPLQVFAMTSPIYAHDMPPDLLNKMYPDIDWKRYNERLDNQGPGKFDRDKAFSTPPLPTPPIL